MAEGRGGVIPGGEGLRAALRWLADRRIEDPSAPRARLVDEAALRFDLSPMEVEFLLQHWKDPSSGGNAS
jgi:hypothetical protein